MTLVIPNSACPTAVVGVKSLAWVNSTSGEIHNYEDWQHTPASCGTPACAEAISLIDDVALSDMKTGFTVRVPIYIPD